MTTEEKIPEVKQERQYKIGPVFCDICRKKVYTVIHKADGTIWIPQLHLTLNENSTTTIPIKCPDGHRNIIQIGIKGEKSMTTGKTPKTPEEMKKEMADRMAKMGRTAFDPNTGKRAMLEAQIKGLTTARDSMQKNVDNMTARITDFQKQLDALPPAAPVTPPAPAK